MNQPLRIGLIGAGMVSRHHLLAWATISDQARVVAVADPFAENAARRAGEFGIGQTYADAGAMLAETELDAIDIAAPRETHAPLVRLAAQNRLPVGPLRVTAAQLSRSSDLLVGEDGAVIQFRAGASVFASFSAHGHPAAQVDRLEILGDRGAIKLNGPTLTCSGASADARTYDLALEYQGSYSRTIAHFVTSLRDNTPFETAPQDNLETLRLVEDCYRLSGWEALQ